MNKTLSTIYNNTNLTPVALGKTEDNYELIIFDVQHICLWFCSKTGRKDSNAYAILQVAGVY